MKIIPALTALFLYANGLAQKTLEISHLMGDFYIYTTYNDFNGTPFPSNGLYAVTDAGVVMIDTPWDEKQFQPLLDSISKKHGKSVVLSISTHYHDDRTAGLAFLKSKGVKTYTSKMTYDLCKIHNEKQSEFYFRKDTTFTVGNLKIQTFYPGEGHTKDNIVIWFGNDKILYGGCLVKSTENSGVGNIADANLKAWPQTIKKVKKQFPNTKFVIPGHFSWTDNTALDHTLRLLRDHQKR